MDETATSKANPPANNGNMPKAGLTASDGRTAASTLTAAQKSQDVERHLAHFLKGPLGSCLTPTWADLGSDLFGADHKITGYRCIAACKDQQALEVAISAHTRALEPASTKELTAALVKLHSLVAHKDEGPDSARLQIAAYLERLSEYPGDIALAVLAEWPELSRWWPAWFDLKPQLEGAQLERKARYAALLRLRHFRKEDPSEPAERADPAHVKRKSQELRQFMAAAEDGKS